MEAKARPFSRKSKRFWHYRSLLFEDLTHAEYAVYVSLSRRADNNSLKCYCDIETIAKGAGIKDKKKIYRVARTALKGLQAKGHIRIVKRGNKSSLITLLNRNITDGEPKIWLDNELVDHFPALKPTRRRVYAWLVALSQGDDKPKAAMKSAKTYSQMKMSKLKASQCFVSHERLAVLSGLSIKTVKAALSELLTLELIRIDSGQYESVANVYTLLDIGEAAKILLEQTAEYVVREEG